jgi:hypothetical protein
MIVRPITMDEMVDVCGLRMSQKTAWLWSLYISALALSGNAREAFEAVETMESKGHIYDYNVLVILWSLELIFRMYRMLLFS